MTSMFLQKSIAFCKHHFHSVRRHALMRAVLDVYERTNELYSPMKAGYRTCRSLTGMKIAIWMKILSRGAEDAGTQYMELTNRRSGLNWSLTRMVLTVAFGDEDANSRYECSVYNAEVPYAQRPLVCSSCRTQRLRSVTYSLDVYMLPADETLPDKANKRPALQDQDHGLENNIPGYWMQNFNSLKYLNI